MITKINFGHTFIRFRNSKNRLIKIHASFKKEQPLIGNDLTDKGKFKIFTYQKITSFLVVKDGIIVSFYPSSDTSNEEARRNVIKFNENGKISWIVEDKYKKIWKKKIKEEWSKTMEPKILESNIKSHKKYPFYNIYYPEIYPSFKLFDSENKIVADETSGCYFVISIDTGEVEFIKAIKD